MLTQCPNCQTTFRVTSEILRVADGQVRCGRCQTQFDALDRLIDEEDAGEVESGRFLRPPKGASPESQIEVDEPDAQEDITLEGRRIEITGTYRTVDGAHGEETREEIIEEWVEIEDVDAATDEGDIEVVEEFETVEEEDPVKAEGASAVSAEPAAYADAAPDFLTPPPRPASAPLWRWLAAPLVILLAVQAVHHYRATLARHPRLGAPLVAVYEALGLPLAPDWNLHAYEIRQWGVVSDPTTPGTLKVRATIANLAEFAQPYPLLKLVLEDRWGDQVRARAFEPADYLDPGAAPDRLLGPAQKTTATIAIVDPGPDAEGFRFDVCLAGKRGTVCAEDMPR